jgi:FAD/FMN-containing dehydrogenase
MLSVTWVDASGAVVRSTRDSPEGRAIVGSLGLLGVVTEVTLQLTPASNTRFDTVWKKSDASIATDILEMLQETPHMLVVWRPDMNRYNAVRLREVGLILARRGVLRRESRV